MKIVAVIPAKSYSGRVPGKNFRSFIDGKSLVEIKLEQCIESGAFDKIYLSSDDNSARVIAERMGVSFLHRDSNLCLDSTPWHEVLNGILDSLPEADDIWVAWCPVTSPMFRRYNELVGVLRSKISEGANSIVTLTPLKHYYLDNDYIPVNHQWGVWHAYAQKLQPVYQLNLACIITQKVEMKRCSYQIGSNPVFFHTVTWEGLDIDTMEEFELAQWYYNRYISNTTN